MVLTKAPAVKNVPKPTDEEKAAERRMTRTKATINAGLAKVRSTSCPCPADDEPKRVSIDHDSDDCKPIEGESKSSKESIASRPETPLGFKRDENDGKFYTDLHCKNPACSRPHWKQEHQDFLDKGLSRFCPNCGWSRRKSMKFEESVAWME